MAMIHTLRTIFSDGTPIDRTVSISVEAQIRQSVSIPAGATAQLVALTIDVSQMAYAFLLSDFDLTLKTNSSGSPANTIALEAGKPLAWRSGGTGHPANPFTVDVTALYVANPAEDPATLTVAIGFDPTL